MGALALYSVRPRKVQSVKVSSSLFRIKKERKEERKEIRTRFSKSHPGLVAPGAPRAKPASIMAMRNFLFSQLVSVTWARCCREKQDVGDGLTYMLKDGRRWFSTR